VGRVEASSGVVAEAAVGQLTLPNGESRTTGEHSSHSENDWLTSQFQVPSASNSEDNLMTVPASCDVQR